MKLSNSGINKTANLIFAALKEWHVTVDSSVVIMPIYSKEVIDNEKLRVSFKASETQLVGNISKIALIDEDDNVFADEDTSIDKPDTNGFYKSIDIKVLEV